MPRSLVRQIIRADTGQVVVFAKVEPLLEGTTTPIPDAYAAESGGSTITSVVTNVQGEAVFWMDTYRDQIDLRVSSDSSTYLAGSVGVVHNFTTFTETVAVPVAGHLTDSAAHAGTLARLDRLPVNPKEAPHNAVGNGIADDTAAIVSAIAAAGTAGEVYLPKGTFACNNVMVNFVGLKMTGKGVLKKNANGPVLILDAANIDIGVEIQGAGATYTGVGIDVRNAADYRLRGPITDTASYCVDHTVNNAAMRGGIAGPVFMQTRGGTLASVRYPPDDLPTTGTRSIVSMFTGGGVGVDLAGGTMTYVIGCNFTELITSAGTTSAMVIGCRIAGPLTVHGEDIVFVGNEIGGAVTFDTDSLECVYSANRCITGVVDNGINNTIEHDRVTSSDLLAATVNPMLLASTMTLNANQAVYERVTLGSGRVSKIGLHVGASSGNISLAVFGSTTGNANAARPSARRATSGSVPCPAVGYAEVALDVAVNVTNQDWFSVVADNTTASFYRAGAAGFTSSLANGVSHHQNSAFPQPATAAPSAGSIFSIILVGVI